MGHYSVHGGWCYHVAFDYLVMLPACHFADHSPCNWDDHCVDYVLMGSAALIAQQGQSKAFGQRLHDLVRCAVGGGLSL